MDSDLRRNDEKRRAVHAAGRDPSDVPMDSDLVGTTRRGSRSRRFVILAQARTHQEIRKDSDLRRNDAMAISVLVDRRCGHAAHALDLRFFLRRLQNEDAIIAAFDQMQNLRRRCFSRFDASAA